MGARHRPVEVVEVESFAAGNAIRLAPTIGREIRAATHQPVQDGEEHGTFECEAIPAAARQAGDDALTAGVCPEPFKQQCRADTVDSDGWGVASPGSVEHHRLPHEARAGAQQPIELPAGLEFIQSAKRCDHALTHLLAGAVALDDLQVDAPLRLLAAEVHTRLGVGAHRLRPTCVLSMGIITMAWHYIFGRITAHA